MRISMITAAVAALTLTTSVAWAYPGDLDATFGDAGVTVLELAGDEHPYDVASYGSKTYVAADNGCNGPLTLARFTAGGAPDSEFSDDGVGTVNLGDSCSVAMAAQSNGRPVVASLSVDGIAIGRLTAAGVWDDGFSGNGRTNVVVPGGATAMVGGVTVDAQGRIVVVAGRFNIGEGADFVVLRLLPNGRPDNSFAGDGLRIFDATDGPVDIELAQDVVTDDNNRIIVVGGTSGQGNPGRIVVARLTETGELHTNFSGDGRKVLRVNANSQDDAYSVTIDGSGRLLIGAVSWLDEAYGFAAVRLLADGSFDDAFSGNGRARVACACSSGEGVLTTDGFVFVGEKLLNPVDPERSASYVGRLHRNGALDLSFGNPETPGSSMFDLSVTGVASATGAVLLGNGRVVVVGALRTDYNLPDNNIFAIRLTEN